MVAEHADDFVNNCECLLCQSFGRLHEALNKKSRASGEVMAKMDIGSHEEERGACRGYSDASEEVHKLNKEFSQILEQFVS